MVTALTLFDAIKLLVNISEYHLDMERGIVDNDFCTKSTKRVFGNL